MTTETRAVAPAAASSGHLVAAEDLVGGQYVHVRPLARSGREWCQIRGAKRLRYYMRLELVRSDGVEFWWKVFPSHMLRTLATAAPDARPRARSPGRSCASSSPTPSFRVRPSAGDVTVTWTDGPALSAVMTALAEGGVAHMRCSRTSSPLARAAVVIRQARESSLHDSTRFTALCNDLDALTQDEWLLGRQLLAFAGRTSDATALTSTPRRIGLTILADTAGLPRPTDIDCCSGCQGSPRFTIRADGSAQTLFACATCVSHYATGGFEILPLATSAIPIARAIGLLERTLVDAGGARFQVDGFSIEAGALTATLKLNPIDQYGHPTCQSWTLLSSLDGWTVD